MHSAYLMEQARARAAERMHAAKQSYLERAIPKLDEGQCCWICEEMNRDPAFFDAMVLRFGTEQVRGFREAYAGTMSQFTNEPMSQREEPAA